MTPLVFFLVLSLLFCNITHGQQQEEVTYKLYPLVPFSIQIYSSSGILPSVNDDTLKTTIQSVTELYLKQFIDAEILHDEAPMMNNIGTSTIITGVALQLSIINQRPSQTTSTNSSIVALVSSGSAAFEQSSSSSSTNTTGNDDDDVVMDGFLKQSLQKAFSLPDLATFQERLMLTPQEYLQQMTNMIVTLLDNNDGPNDNNDTTTIPPSSESTTRTTTRRVTVTTTLTGVFVITFCIVVFVRMRRRHKMVNHHADVATSHHTYTSGGSHHHHHYDVRNLACRAHPPPPEHHGMDPYEQCGTTTTPRLMMMKARVSSLLLWKKNPIHDDDSHVTTMTNDAYPIHNPRNTMTTTTTTSNHSHSRYSYRNNNNNNEEEEDVVDHHIHRSGPFHGGSLAAWVKSISSNVFHPSNEENECLFWHEEDSSGKRIVYRDFPRHDGTPCLIYNSPAVREQSRKKQMVRSTSATNSHHNVNSTTVWATSNQEENNNDDEEEEPVDSFVDRLEQLMVVRHEQYEERRHLEMIKRKSSRKMSLQQAEAALDDFLDISMEEEEVVPPRVVSPTEQQQQRQQMRTLHVEESNLKMASHLRAQQHAQVSWDEEDPTITDERGVFS